MRPPPAPVLNAFGLQDSCPRLLAGGRGTTWHAGNCILKPVDLTEGELCWQAATLAALAPARLRLCTPHLSRHGTYLIEGWAAWTFLPGCHEPGRWDDILQVARELHDALAPLPLPEFLGARRDAWAHADRVAWGEQSIEAYLSIPVVRTLAALRRPVVAPAQLIHGDLTGNVLFLDGNTPAVIDLSLYWRPVAYAAGIVVADALVWEGADERLLTTADEWPDFAQCFVRALLFRIVTDTLRNHGTVNAQPYERAVELACGLVAR